MLSVRVAAALVRTLPRRAGFVSILTKQFISAGDVAVSVFNIIQNRLGVKGSVNSTGR